MSLFLLTGGYSQDYNDTLSSAEVYDPASNAWTLIESMPTPRGDVMCANLMDTFVVLGGYWDPTGENPPEQAGVHIVKLRRLAGAPAVL